MRAGAPRSPQAMSRPKLDPFPGAVPIAVFVLPWRGRLRGGRCSRAIRDVPSRIRGHGDLGFHPISGMQSQKGANSRRRASLIRGRVAAQQAGRGLTETPDGVPPPGEPGDPTRTRRFPSRSTAGAATGEPSRPAPSIPSSRGGADRARPRVEDAALLTGRGRFSGRSPSQGRRRASRRAGWGSRGPCSSPIPTARKVRRPRRESPAPRAATRTRQGGAAGRSGGGGA